MRLIVEKLYSPRPAVEDQPQPRAGLLTGLLWDADGQEDLYLDEIAKAEAGETILDLYNNHVHAYLYPKLAVVEDMWDPNLEDEDAEGPPRCTFLTLAEAKQLILDWLEAKKRWCAE